MKKALILILALALVMSLSAPAFAAEDVYKQTELYFYYDVPEPIYSVTIPDEMYLDLGENYLEIAVEGDGDLMGKAVTITFEGTQIYVETDWAKGYVASLLPNDEDDGWSSVWYEIYCADGTNLEWIGDFAVYPAGGTLATFYELGSSQEINIHVYPSQPNIRPNIEYTGYIIFGISLR